MRTRIPATPAAFVASAVVMVFTLATVYAFFVRTLAGQRIDELAFDGAELGQRTLEPFTLTLLDTLPTVAVGIAAILAIMVCVVWRNWFTLAAAVAAALAANISTQILKAFVLTRPDLGVDGYAFNSLPSGHTTVAASAALVVFLVSSRRSRLPVAFIGATFTVVAGIATLTNQWHRPSDVLAGLIVVAFWGCVAGGILVRRQTVDSATAGSPRTGPLLWVAVPCTFITIVAFLLSYLVVDGDRFDRVVAYAGGVAAVVATGFCRDACFPLSTLIGRWLLCDRGIR